MQSVITVHTRTTVQHVRTSTVVLCSCIEIFRAHIFLSLIKKKGTHFSNKKERFIFWKHMERYELVIFTSPLYHLSNVWKTLIMALHTRATVLHVRGDTLLQLDHIEIIQVHNFEFRFKTWNTVFNGKWVFQFYKALESYDLRNLSKAVICS